ncbi:MAG: amidohydrolase family protein [Myxococcota bacterium]
MRALLPLMIACGTASAEPDAPPVPLDGVVLSGATIVGQDRATIAIRGGRFVEPEDGMSVVDLSDRWIVPAFIDSHVHVAYDPRGDELVRGGIVGGVDWAAPLAALSSTQAPTIVWSGPMITAPGGYPLDSWGADGYGIAVETPEEARSAVDEVYEAGARVVKIPMGASTADLSDEVISATIERAHEKNMPVGVHALSDRDALRAAQLGADILVHAPNRTLSDETVQAWSTRAFVPTISAFGGSESTRQLATAGAEPLYGTDFGNTRVAGISQRELSGMVQAGLTPQQILTSGTQAPATRFGMTDLGAIEVGKEASLLIVDVDPLLDPLTLANASIILHKGAVVTGELPATTP